MTEKTTHDEAGEEPGGADRKEAERTGDGQKKSDSQTEEKPDEKEVLRSKIRDLKAELKNIANQMVRARNIGEQSILKNEQKVKQRELIRLQAKLKKR